MNWHRRIEVLTPLFNRGAYQDSPEIRVPSVRGMVRWWFRWLGGKPHEEKQLFGGMKGFGGPACPDVMASRLVFRIRSDQLAYPSAKLPTLPHKSGGRASPQAAFRPGIQFDLHVQDRFEPLPAELLARAESALEVWLLLGALGLRANRSGGNVWPADDTAPKTPAALRSRLDQLGCRWPVMLVGERVGSNIEELRAAATDTVNGPDWVFGCARGRNRVASALKFKVVRFEMGLRLLAFAPDHRVLEEARKCLHGHRSNPETWNLI
ncbi:MAG: type III-B CRISPR module RAMP protein Cmr1 [Verrucomicrobiae bacterium]|nr:type III-B CRISPR module RAMP protein Cmr1 [Verrucomicrobiae bacterium]